MCSIPQRLKKEKRKRVEEAISSLEASAEEAFRTRVAAQHSAKRLKLMLNTKAKVFI